MTKYVGTNDNELRRQEAHDRRETSRPQQRAEPPDEPAAERTPSLQQVMHRAEAIAAVEPPVDTPPTPINDTGQLNAMARMGGDVDPMTGLGDPMDSNASTDTGEVGLMDGLGDPLRSAGPTEAGDDLGRQLEAVLGDLEVGRR
jgi:hypothetical protein